MSEILRLSREYPSIHGRPAINSVDPRIFTLSYMSDCRAAGCSDLCCSEGVDLDPSEAHRILGHAEWISGMVDAHPDEWFESALTPDPDYPSRAYTATRALEGRCVFLTKSGCAIHAYCLEKAIDYRELKPMVSVLFPITFDHGLLMPAPELSDERWICRGSQASLYQGIRPDLLYYFGEGFVAELDSLNSGRQ